MAFGRRHSDPHDASHQRSATRYPRVRLGVAFVLAVSATVVVTATGLTGGSTPARAALTNCNPNGVARHYVAGGDDVPAGHDITESSAYPSDLFTDHLSKYGGPWCLYSTASNGTTSDSYITGGQLSTTWERAPDLITLTVGEQDTTIVDLIGSCFDHYLSDPHGMAAALACEEAVLNDSSAWTNLSNKLVETFNSYKKIFDGRPSLYIAITGYPNPYPDSTTVSDKVTSLCDDTEDTKISCNVNWAPFESALSTADQIIQKLNKTISDAVAPFTTAAQGHFIFVNPYDKFKTHYMKMDVTLKLDTVCHLCGTDGTYFDSHSSNQDFGPSDPWIQAESDGTAIPLYLQPPDQVNDPPVVLVLESQTTSGMGKYPNDKGQKCISDLIWEAVKQKLGVPEAPNTNICT